MLSLTMECLISGGSNEAMAYCMDFASKNGLLLSSWNVLERSGILVLVPSKNFR